MQPSQTKVRGIPWSEYFPKAVADVHEGICPRCNIPLTVVERAGEVIARRGMCSCCGCEFATIDDVIHGPGFVTYNRERCHCG